MSIFSREIAIGLKSQNFKYKKRKVDFNKNLCYNIYRKNKNKINKGNIIHMVFGPILDKMIDEGKTFQEITERFAQELLQAQEKRAKKEIERKKEKEKEEKLALLLENINDIMSCYFPELYVKIAPEVYSKYMNTFELNNLIYAMVKDMYLESVCEEQNKKLTF